MMVTAKVYLLGGDSRRWLLVLYSTSYNLVLNYLINEDFFLGNKFFNKVNNA